jgi:hypothetical protein
MSLPVLTRRQRAPEPERFVRMRLRLPQMRQ